MSRELQIPSVPSEKESLHTLGLAAICFGFFMVILDTSVVNVALPAMQRDLHGTLSGWQWVVNGYTLVFASLLLSAGTREQRAKRLSREKKGEHVERRHGAIDFTLLGDAHSGTISVDGDAGTKKL